MTTRHHPPANEEPPFKRHNTDGRVNAGSFEVSGVLDVIALAHRLYLEEHPRHVGPPEIRELRPLARHLVTAVDQVQYRATDRVNRMAASSARAMKAVRCALYAYPVPWGADPLVQREWWHRVVDHAAGIYDLALELVDEGQERPRATG